jgi:glyceraldehyde-3-phosphate dehydrogenase (NADP+)
MARKLYVGGEWLATDKTFEVKNPYDGSTVEEVHLADAQTIDAAINYSVDGFRRMRALSSAERIQLLDKTVALLKERREDLAQSICLEGGKCINEARGEAERTVQTFTFARDEAGRIGGEYMPLDLNKASKGRFGITRRFPIGPILGISPFNFPLNLVSHKVAPALACGSAMVLKPATYTPITSLKLAEVIDEAGFPPGALNVVACPREQGQVLVEDDRFALLTFTGSPDAGWQMKADAGKKRVVLELGGDAACIVDSTADMEQALGRCIIGTFAHAGQICISIQRILLEKSIADEFTERFVAMAKDLKMGDPRDESTQLGPMITESAAERAEEWVQEAIDKGAELILGGERKGAMLPPTVLSGVRKDMRLGCDEAFAPIVCLFTWENFTEAIDIVNSSRYGLQAGIFSCDVGRITRAWEEIEVGGVIAGDIPTYRIDHMPYGGVKDSGFGREGLRWAIHDMTEERLLVMNPERD